MNSRVELIAECSTNAGGSMALAKEFIWRYAEAGADFVKFQHTRVKHLRPDDPQRDWFERAEMTVDQFAELKAECEKAGTKFLTTVFNAADVPEIYNLGCEAVKIGSAEHASPVVLRAARDVFPRILRSVHLVSRVAWSAQFDRTRTTDTTQVLSCVSRYPASVRACEAAIEKIGYYNIIGYSDHSIGLEMAKWAIECGATIIEKHVSLPNQARPIRPWEATVEEFTALRAFADEDPSRLIGRWQHA